MTSKTNTSKTVASKPSTREVETPADATARTGKADAAKAKLADAKTAQVQADLAAAALEAKAVEEAKAQYLAEHTPTIVGFITLQREKRFESEMAALQAAVAIVDVVDTCFATLKADGTDSYDRKAFLAWAGAPTEPGKGKAVTVGSLGLGLGETQASDYLSVGRFYTLQSAGIRGKLATFEQARQARIIANGQGEEVLKRTLSKAPKGSSGATLKRTAEAVALEVETEQRAALTGPAKAKLTKAENKAKADRESALVTALEGKYRDQYATIVVAATAVAASDPVEAFHLSMAMALDLVDPTGRTSKAIRNLQAQAKTADAS